MVGTIVLSPIDAASQQAVVGSVQLVVVARAQAPRDAAVQHCCECLGSEHPDFELEKSARSVVQFEGGVYVCIYVCMHVCMCLCIYVCVYVYMYVCMCVPLSLIYSKVWNQLGKVANPARGHLDRDN